MAQTNRVTAKSPHHLKARVVYMIGITILIKIITAINTIRGINIHWIILSAQL